MAQVASTILVVKTLLRCDEVQLGACRSGLQLPSLQTVIAAFEGVKAESKRRSGVFCQELHITSTTEILSSSDASSGTFVITSSIPAALDGLEGPFAGTGAFAKQQQQDLEISRSAYRTS